MGVQGNHFVYVDVVRHIEKLGGSQGYADNAEAFVEALKKGLSELLPEDDDHVAAILRHAAMPREIGTAADEKAGRRRYITFHDWLLDLESLGGSKGFEDFLSKNPTGIEPVMSEAKHKENEEPARLWEIAGERMLCMMVHIGYIAYFGAEIPSRERVYLGSQFIGAEWFREIIWTEGKISYDNDDLFLPLGKLKKVRVEVTPLGLAADYFSPDGHVIGQSLVGAKGGHDDIVAGEWK